MIALATRAGKAALVKAIEVIGDAVGDSDDYDRCNALLCMAIGILLNQSRNIEPKISEIAARTFLAQLEKMEAGQIRH